MKLVFTQEFRKDLEMMYKLIDDLDEKIRNCEFEENLQESKLEPALEEIIEQISRNIAMNGYTNIFSYTRLNKVYEKLGIIIESIENEEKASIKERAELTHPLSHPLREIIELIQYNGEKR